MKDVMVDLETMGTGHRAAIVSIGAVYFDPWTGEEDHTFYKKINLESAVDAGLVMDADTVLWWLKQSDEARREISSLWAGRLHDVLENFSGWLPSKARIWGNGSNFDNRILREAYEATGLLCPWHWSDDRDMRTLVDTGAKLGIVTVVEPRKDAIAHHALHDALRQVDIVTAICQAMRDMSERR